MAKKPPATKSPEVVEPRNVPAVLADWIVTGGSFEGIANLTLGTIDHALPVSRAILRAS